MIKQISEKQLERLLEPVGHHWMHISRIVAGDRVNWWDQDATVVSVTLRGNKYYLKVIDPLDKKEKEFPYNLNTQLSVAQRARLN